MEKLEDKLKGKLLVMYDEIFGMCARYNDDHYLSYNILKNDNKYVIQFQSFGDCDFGYINLGISEKNISAFGADYDDIDPGSILDKGAKKVWKEKDIMISNQAFEQLGYKTF